MRQAGKVVVGGFIAIAWLEALIAAPSTVAGIAQPDLLLRAFLGATAFLVTLVLVGPDRIRDLQDALTGNHAALSHAASDEVARIVDEGQALKSNTFTGEKPNFYEVKYWWESASEFVEAAFGKTERQTFMAPLAVNEWTPFRENYDDVLEGRCDRLRDLAKRVSQLPSLVRVSRRKLKSLGKTQMKTAATNPLQAAVEELEAEAKEARALATQQSAETPDPCGEQLSLLAMGANQLAHNLANFESWWPAIRDEGFNGKLRGGHSTTHAEAMETLLFMFAQFFSPAWTYQQQCRNHPHRNEVKAWVDEVFNAFADDPVGPTDYSLMSHQLHKIGERSTTDWGMAEARIISRPDFKVELENHAEDFERLREFLLAAGPGTEARARLEAVEKSVRRVKGRLNEKGYQP